MTFSIREELTTSTDPKDRPLLDLVWDYPTEGPRAEPSAEAVLREISGVGPDGRAVSGYPKLKADGSTGCGCSIYSGVYATEVHQAARRTPGSHQSWVAPQRRLADRRGGPGRRPPAAKQVVAVEPWVAEVAALTAVYLGPQQLLVLAQAVPVEGADRLTGVGRL